MFEYLSSPMNWCESKFVYSIYIAEFWNSITSLFFCLIAYYGYHNHKHLNIDNTFWILLGSIGIGSFIFHFTLSFAGQFLDELSIILLTSYCIKYLYDLDNLYYYIISLFLSLISWFFPAISPFILISSGTILVLSTSYNIEYYNSRILWNRYVRMGLFASLCWVFDFLCYFNTHMLWHIFIGITSYLVIIFVIKCRNDFILTNEFLPKLL